MVSRLAAFGPPPWRTTAEIVEGERRTLGRYFDGMAPATSTVLVATRDADEPIAFAYLEQLVDYFTLERHGHIGILAVAEHAEGTGAGAALMRATEAWARSRQYHTITLSVFEDNARARAVYEHFGYRTDTVRYIKLLDP